MLNHTKHSDARVGKKKNLIRCLHLSLAAVAALSLAGCGLSEPDAVGDASNSGDSKVLRLAHVYEASHPMETCGVTALNRELEDSGISIESFPSGQLGSEAESLEQVALGGLDLAIAGPSFLGVWHDEAAVLDGAYLFDSVDHFAETIAGPTMAKIYDEMSEETGIKVLSGWYYGTRQVTSNKEINGPDDMNGVKIRTPDAPLYLTNIKIMGGTATPMALGEVYLALQQGVIDAQENPIPTISTAKFNEVQDFINITGHMIQGVNIVTNTALFEALSSEQQSALEDAMAIAAAEVRECVETQEQDILVDWKADGSITVNEDVDRDAFAKRAREMLPNEVTWGDLYKDIQSDK
ncbi:MULTISPECIES: sialic acid TRAP transporter substrate-binding protein SiaP [unclassified Cryobacterium]|uniref:sialic acid TRAP transporter substrate-binding protein SiaP n=1 Tax=unclassified Cryobacterium TaxID=2649013 RepID=UPI000CE3A6B4|nr:MULTISPECIES: sialic acid TRAP transporter substrate-binding protein SiaP [unclassified Cryobacterium]